MLLRFKRLDQLLEILLLLAYLHFYVPFGCIITIGQSGFGLVLQIYLALQEHLSLLSAVQALHLVLLEQVGPPLQHLALAVVHDHARRDDLLVRD